MSARYGDDRVVPLKVARQLLEQRDRLAAELQSQRRTNDRLESELDAAIQQREELEDRVAAAEEEASSLRAKLAEAADSPPGDDQSGNEAVNVLHRRIENLTADLERVRRRTSESVAAARRDERVRLLSGIGDVLDSVERALAIDDTQGPWRRGLEGIRGQIRAFLRGEGAELVGEIGEALDPKVHRAVATVDDADVEGGHVARVERFGIVLDDGTVVRPAEVVVAQ